MRNRKLLAALYVAMGMSLASALPIQGAFAANADGSLAGRLTEGDGKAATGVEVTVRNPETGFTRTVAADSDGNYRFQSLPVGTYSLEARKDGKSLGKLENVAVGLGIGTTADVVVGAATLEAVEVLGTRVVHAVDVSSTESATNVTREELDRLPVERDVMSVALLAPGLTKGDKDLGDDTTVSFGGSSVAENSVYINGLNVTDFYNRVGASTVPYAFYEEFQVKTGGYSVEFGRTTGGVINAVTRSGTNEFDFGTEVAWEPSSLQSSGRNSYDADGNPLVISRYDEYDRTSTTLYASGPIVKDRLFFFALYEKSDYQPVNTNDAGDQFDDGKADDDFWGAKIDWQINDRHLLEALAFSDRSETATDVYAFDLAAAERGSFQDTEFEDNGGENWALTYTGYLTDTFSLRALYGENDRKFSRVSANAIDCSRYVDNRQGFEETSELGCTSVANVTERLDNREAARLDFEWGLGDHQLRFGLDREVNTSSHDQFYPGTDRLRYDIEDTLPNTTLDNGGIVPDGVFAYVRSRSNEVDGEFETLNSAYYVEDNWNVTPSLVLNGGLRLESFDNKNSDGDSYIKIDDMLAPRFGFSWDVKGDRRSKVFGNVGRYYLPVANVINIKQAGGFLDERTYYVLDGLEPFEHNGETYQRPILGAQIGPVDNSQGDGTAGDLRGEVDADMDPVYQDELILGFQGMIDDKWSWGVRGIYRKLTNAIDDMEVTSNGILCGGEPGYVGFVMGNPGRPLTVLTDTDCDGENDGFVTIDTGNAGWALYDDDGNFTGERGFDRPKRDYKALEFVIDRAWDDKWTLNASYTLAWAEGNAEGPVNSDTNFADAGRTEAFDDPWVNLGGYGYLPNDRRHSFKLRGAYGFNDHWLVGGTVNVLSGRPVNAFGVGNPFDGTSYNSFYVCVENCQSPVPSERVFELNPRGSQGELPWTYDVGAYVSYRHSFGVTDLEVKLTVFNLLNQDSVIEVDETLDAGIGVRNPDYRLATGYQAPRSALLTLTLDF
jgi:Carboxypeptidase regulatory-like domain/TonB-dependent Receptor Plug Domain